MKCICLNCGNEHEIDEQYFTGGDDTEREPSASEDAANQPPGDDAPVELSG